jgi:hypothetical protein
MVKLSTPVYGIVLYILRTHPVTVLSIGSGYFRAKPFPV